MEFQDRIDTEALILGSIYQDLTLVTESNLTEDDFSTGKTSFYYALARELVKNVKSLDELSVQSWVNASGVSELYKEYGGFQSIKNLQKIGNTRNFLSYVDNLKKHIIVENLKEKRHFDIYEPIEYKGKIVTLSDSLPLMNAYDFHNLIQLMFNDLEVEIGNKDLVFEDLFFTDQELQDKIDGKKLDTSEFDVVLEWEEDGDSRYLQNFKILNEELGGLQRKNGLHVLGASSGVGKTTFSLNMALGLINTSNENVLIISNEQQSAYYKNLLMAIVCQVVFKCYSLTRKKISRNEFSNETEIEVIKVANEFIKDKFKNKLRFLSVSTFNKDNICAIIKREKLRNNTSYVILDTFKFEGGKKDTNIATELVETSRAIDNVATEYDVGIILPVQLLVSSDKTSFLTSSALSNSKQIKEVSNSVMLMRRVRPFELDPKSDKFLKPYVWRKSINGNYVKKQLTIIDSTRNEKDRSKRFDKDVIDASKQHVLMRLDKNRNGNDDVLILYEIDAVSGLMKEKARCDYVFMGMLAD